MLTTLDGLYQSAEYERETVKASGQAGESVVSGSFSPRGLTIQFAVVGETRERLRALCENAQAVLTPTMSGTLTMDTPLGARSIRVWPDGTPSLSLKADGCALAEVGLTAYEPLFTEAEPRVTEMAAYAGGWQFPTSLQTGWVFGERLPSRLTALQNPGQTPCGYTAVLRATGSVRDPYLLHVASGARLTLERDLLGGERVEIVCMPTKRRVELVADGERTNLIGQLRADSAFALLQPGENLLLCGALEHEENLCVSIEYQPMYA